MQALLNRARPAAIASIPAEGFQASYIRFEDMTEVQIRQARNIFAQHGPLGANYLYLVDNADGCVHARKHKSNFTFTQLQSINSL